jgi:hypothetical protein
LIVIKRPDVVTRNFLHGHSTRDHETTEHKIWRGMIERCENPRHVSFKYYGGRGIKVCKRWRKSFAAFLADMGPRPPGKTLDRIDPNGNYTPKNCRWTTPSKQRLNQRPHDDHARVQKSWDGGNREKQRRRPRDKNGRFK